MTEFFDVAYERQGYTGICKGCGAVYEGTAAFAVKHARSGCIVPRLRSACMAAGDEAWTAISDILGHVSAARFREEGLRSELKRLSEMNLDLYDKLQEARRSTPEWWGTEAENKSQRRVNVRSGSTVLSSHDQVRWARHVLSAMVFGLSFGRTGSKIVEETEPSCDCFPEEPEAHDESCPAWCHSRCGRCGFVECSCLKVLRP